MAANVDGSGSAPGVEQQQAINPSNGIHPPISIPNGFLQRQSRRFAARPWTYLLASFCLSAALGAVGLIVGDFRVEANNSGWQSRGTPIADRHTQSMLVRWNRGYLRSGGDAAWVDLTSNVQDGWETRDDDDDDDRRRRILMSATDTSNFLARTRAIDRLRFRPDFLAEQSADDENPWAKAQAQATAPDTGRNLQDLFTCDFSWYTSGSMTNDAHLWPVWKTTHPSASALDASVIRDLCVAEEATQEHLRSKGLCYGCQDGECLPPFGLVLFARIALMETPDVGDPDALSMNCTELSSRWAMVQEEQTEELRQCVRDTKELFKLNSKTDLSALPESCPFGFHPALVDDKFDETGVVSYTSSIFATVDDAERLFDETGAFHRGSDLIQGAYDTQYEDFVYIQIDSSLMNDFALATGSAAITALAILVHTRSLFLTFVGLLQIILSFPLAYFIYALIARLEFFPLLNFIGIFVVFALGADDVFVAVDKWKNARIEHRNLSTEDIAAIALPDAASAMFLTTITTAVAFFGTAICPVAPVKCFAVFCGLLIVVDYILCILLVFPALAIYDRWRDRKNCCMSCHCCHRLEADEQDSEKPSLIRRIILAFYNALHRVRWCLLAALLAAFGVCVYYSTQMKLPTSSDVRLLSSKFQYEKAFKWRYNILYDRFLKDTGSTAYVQFGTTAADTGTHTNPYTFSQLVLDESFDPKSREGQAYLLQFCPKFFEQSFAEKPQPEYECAVNKFDAWLKSEAETNTNSSASSWEWYQTCKEAKGLPMDPSDFHACMSAWAELENEKTVFTWNNEVKIIFMKFNSGIRYDSPFAEIDEEWKSIERWMDNERSVAPSELGTFFHTSFHFWWYDTNHQMLQTAYGAAAIAISVAGLVILLSSRSFILTAFSVFSIAFVLTSVTAMLVGYGWTLGFLESICFAILIGISCDFVIHFSHAYAVLPGKVCRSERTKYALVRLGPSILAAAFTTVSAAIIMLFCVITFFEKFALILLFTILQATVGSFVVFITLADCFGPSQPTGFVDSLMVRISLLFGQCKKRKSDDEPNQTAHTTGDAKRADRGSASFSQKYEDAFVENEAN